MLTKIKSFLIGCVVIMAVMSPGVLGQEGKVALKDKRITIQMTQKSLYTVFWRLIQKYDVAIGLEESSLDKDHWNYLFETNVGRGRLKPEPSSDIEPLGLVPRVSENLITVNFKDARLEEVMDAIVKQMENYDWEINNDVVNIYPKRGRDDRLKKLLDTRVRVFAVGMGDEVGSIQAQLMLFQPEFRAFLKENNLEAMTDRAGPLFERRILPDGMAFTDKTFKELLNAITKSKRGGWILQIKIQKDKPGREFVEILI